MICLEIGRLYNPVERKGLDIYRWSTKLASSSQQQQQQQLYLHETAASWIRSLRYITRSLLSSLSSQRLFCYLEFWYSVFCNNFLSIFSNKNFIATFILLWVFWKNGRITVPTKINLIKSGGKEQLLGDWCQRPYLVSLPRRRTKLGKVSLTRSCLPVKLVFPDDATAHLKCTRTTYFCGQWISETRVCRGKRIRAHIVSFIQGWVKRTVFSGGGGRLDQFMYKNLI